MYPFYIKKDTWQATKQDWSCKALHCAQNNHSAQNKRKMAKQLLNTSKSKQLSRKKKSVFKREKLGLAKIGLETVTPCTADGSQLRTVNPDNDGL